MSSGRSGAGRGIGVVGVAVVGATEERAGAIALDGGVSNSGGGRLLGGAGATLGAVVVVEGVVGGDGAV